MTNFKKSHIILSIFAILILYQLISSLATMSLFPSLADIFSRTSPQLFVHLGISTLRILVATFVAMGIGLGFVILILLYPIFDKFLSPIFFTISPIPKIAFLPVLMLLFGIGEMSKFLTIFLIVFSQIFINLRDALFQIRYDYFIPFYSITTSKHKFITHFLLPHLRKPIFTSIKISLATSLSVLFFAESYGTRLGIGYFILDSWTRFDYKSMYLGIFAIAFLGLSLTLFAEWLSAPRQD